MRKRKTINFNHKDIWNVSLDCKGLIIDLMDSDPDARPTTIDLLASKWLKSKIEGYRGIHIDVEIFDK